MVEESGGDKDVPTILGAYGATLSESDQLLFRRIQACDEDPSTNLERFQPLLWGSGAEEAYKDVFRLGPQLWRRPSENQVFARLNGGRIRKTAEELPLGLTLNGDPPSNRPDLYDPRFLLPLFASVLGAEWRPDLEAFVAKGCLTLVLTVTSLREAGFRSLAYLVLSRFCEQLRSTTADPERQLPAKPQLLYILTLLRNTLKRPGHRLPCLTATFLGKACELMLSPGNACYPAVNNFLLLRSTLELEQVPEFLRLLHGKDPQNARKERLWLLGVISAGMREAKDFRILEKHYGVKLLLSYFQTPIANFEERQLILKILERITGLHSGAQDLHRSGVLPAWLLAQAPLTEEERKQPRRLWDPLARVLLRLLVTLCPEDKEGSEESIRRPGLSSRQLKLAARVLGTSSGLGDKLAAAAQKLS